MPQNLAPIVGDLAVPTSGYVFPKTGGTISGPVAIEGGDLDMSGRAIARAREVQTAYLAPIPGINNGGVTGPDPVLPEHLATKQYVDATRDKILHVFDGTDRAVGAAQWWTGPQVVVLAAPFKRRALLQGVAYGSGTAGTNFWSSLLVNSSAIRNVFVTLQGSGRACITNVAIWDIPAGAQPTFRQDVGYSAQPCTAHGGTSLTVTLGVE